jgi:hypothetical protein
LLLDNHFKLSAQEPTKLTSIISITPVMNNLIVDWINLSVVLLSKNWANANKAWYVEHIQKALSSLNLYRKEIEIKPFVSTKLQQDFFMCIIGLCKGDYEFISIIASKHGVFEHDKVEEILSILSKFQQSIFGKKSYGLPPISKGLKTAFFGKKKNMINELDMFGTVKLVAEGGKEALNQVKQKASEVAESTMQSGGEFVTDLLYRDLFKMFDKDDGGYIGYGEFKDI